MGYQAPSQARPGPGRSWIQSPRPAQRAQQPQQPGRCVAQAIASIGMSLGLGVGLAAGLLASPAAQAADAASVLKPCRIEGVSTEVQCGRIQRPLDPARPDGKRIELHFVVVPALARNKLPDPVLLLAGGPGQSAISLTGTVLPRLSRLNYRRDLVFIDQRGTGRSAPLQCRSDLPLTMKEAMEPQARERQLDECRRQLEALPHGDLRFYTTTIAMQDMDAVRDALGVSRWNLIGASYGTRAALEYERQFPTHVRRAVIDGVAPPDMVLPAAFSRDGQAALDAVFTACESDPACKARFPALRTEWQALLKSLPRRVTLQHPMTGQSEEVMLTRESLLGAVRPPLYVPPLAAALPAAIHDASQGRFSALGALAGQVGGGPKATRLAAGMHFSVICAEDMPRLAQSTDVPGADFGLADRTLYTSVCKDWPRGTVPSAFYEIPPAQTPVLVLSGGADPVTPPRHGARVTERLGAKARHVVVPQAGHGVALTLGCMRDVVFRFIDTEQDDQALKVEADCAARIPRPPIFLPPDPATVAAAASAIQAADAKDDAKEATR
ncbi:alpha/beta hydrolase [Roseateles amylovorans]|uniref:Alpha/beta hydrolase n=1 Tax=Roseateles amylovorans TaxID=2978473 RepID=A0ABY6AZ75_9BURK|nr:alpha/beta hydrolase [Roseateles amylovorans]UXH78476.1 alpha/beta hydrolase [Roseateles amylovorans]